MPNAMAAIAQRSSTTCLPGPRTRASMPFKSRHVAVPPALHPFRLEFRRPQKQALGLTRHPSDQAIADFMAIQHLGHLLEIGAPILRMQRAGRALDREQLALSQANRLHRRFPCCAVRRTARWSRRLQAAGLSQSPAAAASWGFLL